MNWKKEAVDNLKEYRFRRQAMESIPEEIRRLEEESTRIRSVTTDATPVHGGGGSTREDALLSNIVLRDELKARLRDTRRWLARVDRALATLDDDEQRVLRMLYVDQQKGAVARLCEELKLQDDRSVYKRKDKAVRHFTIAMYGITES